MPSDVPYCASALQLSECPLDVGSLSTTALGGAPTALVLELEPALGVRIAAELNRRQPTNVVVILPRWPHADAILPTADLIAALVETSPRVRQRQSAPHVVFVLDGDRSRSVRRPPSDSRIDNRYDLAVADLPGLRELRSAGIQRIVKLSPSPSPRR
jgi:hypothetical protein